MSARSKELPDIGLPLRLKPPIESKPKLPKKSFFDLPPELRFTVYEQLLNLEDKKHFVIEPLPNMKAITNLLWASRKFRADVHELVSCTKVEIKTCIMHDRTLRPHSSIMIRDMGDLGTKAHQRWPDFNKNMPFKFKFTRVLVSVVNNDSKLRLTVDMDFKTKTVRILGLPHSGLPFLRPPPGFPPIQRPSIDAMQVFEPRFVNAMQAVDPHSTGFALGDMRLLLKSIGSMPQPKLCWFWSSHEMCVDPDYLC